MTLRRSVLYLPGSNARALEKAASLPCDSLIFDLEDAVAPAAKEDARALVTDALANGAFGFRERVVRVNALATPWGEDDLSALAAVPPDALLFPKVETVEELKALDRALMFNGLAQVPRWLMVETPRAIVDLAALLDAASEAVTVLVLGTSDLVAELHAQHVPDRSNLAYALQRVVLIARACGRVVLDGVQLDFRDLEAFELSSLASRRMGFDGRTLIHPTQIAAANRIYGPSSGDLAQARRIIDAWDAALAEGRGVVELDGRLVENLHAEEARRVLEQGALLAQREG